MAAIIPVVIGAAIDNPYVAIYVVYGGYKAVKWGVRKGGDLIDDIEEGRAERRAEAEALMLEEARTCRALQLLAFATTWSERLGSDSAAGWLPLDYLHQSIGEAVAMLPHPAVFKRFQSQHSAPQALYWRDKHIEAIVVQERAMRAQQAAVTPLAAGGDAHLECGTTDCEDCRVSFVAEQAELRQELLQLGAGITEAQLAAAEAALAAKGYARPEIDLLWRQLMEPGEVQPCDQTHAVPVVASAALPVAASTAPSAVLGEGLGADAAEAVTVSVYENQRVPFSLITEPRLDRYSAAHLLPTDRPGWSGKDGDKRPDLTAGPVAPVGWRWLDPGEDLHPPPGRSVLADPAPAALTPAGLDPVVVHVGVSAAKTQTVPLPGLGFTVSPVPHNKQGAGWKDRFAVSVAGDALTVRRTDSERGWGQELELLATPPPPAVQLSSLIRLGLEAPAGVDTAAGTELAPEPVPEPALEPAAATRPLLMIAGPVFNPADAGMAAGTRVVVAGQAGQIVGFRHQTFGPNLHEIAFDDCATCGGYRTACRVCGTWRQDQRDWVTLAGLEWTAAIADPEGSGAHSAALAEGWRCDSGWEYAWNFSETLTASGAWSPVLSLKFGAKSWCRRRRWDRTLVRDRRGRPEGAVPGLLRCGEPFRISLYGGQDAFE